VHATPAYKITAQNAFLKTIGADVKNNQFFSYKTTSNTFNALIATLSYRKMKAVTILLASADTSSAIDVEESGKDLNIYVSDQKVSKRPDLSCFLCGKNQVSLNRYL
jgi:hypothetical protein